MAPAGSGVADGLGAGSGHAAELELGDAAGLAEGSGAVAGEGLTTGPSELVGLGEAVTRSVSHGPGVHSGGNGD